MAGPHLLHLLIALVYIAATEAQRNEMSQQPLRRATLLYGSASKRPRWWRSLSRSAKLSQDRPTHDAQNWWLLRQI